MVEDSDSSGSATVTSGDSYSIGTLTMLRLPGYPTSRKGWYDRARREGWEIREVPGNGPGGKTRMFVPPSEAAKLINAKWHELAHPDPSRTHKAEQIAGVYDVTPEHGIVTEPQLPLYADVIVRLSFAVALKLHPIESQDELLRRVSLMAFRMLQLFCEGNILRIEKWLSDSSKLDNLIKLAYEADCVKRGVIPGSDLKSSGL